MELEIDINGSGTKEEIIRALNNIIMDLETMNEKYLEERDIEWEDSTLMTTIKPA